MRARVGERYEGSTLDGVATFFQRRELVGQGLRIFRNMTMLDGVLLVGTVGTGKTAFAAALVRMWLLAGLSALFVPSRRLFREVRETYTPGSKKSESELIDAHCRADLLVIDDLGREGRVSEQVLSVLHDILDERLRHCKPTIVTTNLGEELRDVYGEAIMSRLSTFQVLVMKGPDRRRA